MPAVLFRRERTQQLIQRVNIPLIIWLSIWVQFLPPLAAAMRRRELDGARRAIALWFITMLLAVAAQRFWTMYVDNTNNLFLNYYATPIGGAVVLWAIAELQTRPLARTAVRICIPLIFLVAILGYLFIEDKRNFSTFEAPVTGLVVLCSALLALLSRLHDDSEPGLTSDWLYFLTGITIFFAANTAVSILQSVYTRQQDWASLIITLKFQAGIETFATLLITGGFLWPNRRLRTSGSSSSPALSR